MKEQPILFNTEMVIAVLDDRKTQTRRVVKPQPTESDLRAGTRDGSYTFGHENEGWWIQGPLRIGPWNCPYGVPGDRLWVRETWRPWHESDSECGCGDWCDCSRIPPTPVCYRASSDELMDEDRECGIKWHPSIHMFRKDSRILLEVVSVRVERVQEISEEDARAEGVYSSGWCPTYADPDNAGMAESISAKENFATLWDSINAKRGFGWDANPWVWVVEFKRVEP